jgi:hypothetical protein
MDTFMSIFATGAGAAATVVIVRYLILCITYKEAR